MSTERRKGKDPDVIQQVLRSRVLIFVMLFAITGFLGLPVLWMSPVFSKWEKLVWSIVNTLYTCTLIWITAMICWWAYRQITF